MSGDVLFIGLDAGGSKTELLAAASQHKAVLNLFDASANPARVGFDGSIDVLSRLIEKARVELPDYSVGGVCAGIAGAGRRSEQLRILDGIAANHPDLDVNSITIVHDADIALEAAFEDQGGIMVIAGTGSVALARTNSGETKRVGGWGYRIGDEGSGYVLGLLGLRAYAHAIDGGPETALTHRIAVEFDIRSASDLILRVYEEKMPLQKVAPLVSRVAGDGDEVALKIVKEQTIELARQVGWLADMCPDITRQFALLGGLVNEPFYRNALKEALLEELGDWIFVDPLNRPVVGAWRIAKQRAMTGEHAGRLRTT